MLRGAQVKSVEKEWDAFRYIVKQCTKDACGMRRLGEQGRNGSEEVGVTVAEKSRAFEEWLQRSDGDSYDRYQAQRAVACSETVC